MAGSGSNETLINADELSEWNRTTRLYSDLRLLSKDIWTGRISELPPRGILWRVLLVYRTCDQSTWNDKDEELAKKYKLLKDKYGDMQSDPLKVDETLNDPLNSSLYGNNNEELLPDITKDVERTFPEKEFFRDLRVQESLTRVLYFYSRSHPDISYRQGMHELLGPFLFILSCGDVSGVEKYEPLSYALFDIIMEHAKQWYSQSYTSAPPPIVQKSQHIQEDIIKPADPQLHALLVENSIEPQIWAIRWIRLLFSREFGFDKAMELWDAIFASMETIDLSELVDYICATMLIRIRPKLLKDPSHIEILTTVLNYPVSSDSDSHHDPQAIDSPHAYVENALFLKRNTTVHGGRHLAEHYKGLFPQPAIISPPHSPRIDIGSLVGAAKSMSQKWDIDRRFKQAVNGTRRRAKDSFGGSPRTSSDLTLEPGLDIQNRNEMLAETLKDAIEVLQERIEDIDVKGQRAIGDVKRVKDCLLNSDLIVSSPPQRANSQKKATPEMPTSPHRSSPPLKQKESALPSASLSTSSRNRVKTSITQSEYSWILGSPKQKNQQSEYLNSAKDLFELS